MSLQAVLAPLFLQVALTSVLLFWQGLARVGAINRGETKIKDIALREPNWPPDVQKLTNCYHSQLELPVLFYALTAFALISRKADLLFVVMAWLFVLSRLVHAAIHTTTNHVPRRFRAFAVGVVVLMLMWIIFAVRVLTGV
jgi:hypothetical protein